MSQGESAGVLRQRRHQHQGDIPFVSDVVEDISPRYRRFQRLEAPIQRVRLGEQGRQEGGQSRPRKGQAGGVVRNQGESDEAEVEVADTEGQQEDQAADQGRSQRGRGMHRLVDSKTKIKIYYIIYVRLVTSWCLLIFLYQG